jgi:peptide/nickel transport system permease protein
VRYLTARVLAGIATLLVVTVVVFGAMRLVPGSYADTIIPPEATREQIASIQAEYAVDSPLPVQYVEWVRHLASGDLGSSFGTNVPVSELLARRLPVTLELALLALLLTTVLGLPLALLAGMARRRLPRDGARLGGAIAMSTPAFVVGSLFLYLFSRYSLGLKVGGYVPFADDPIENLRVMLLPAVTLAIFGIALIVRIGRDAVAAVLSEPYVTAALARGESLPHIVRHHVLRNAAIPILTVLAIYTGELMGGAVIVESLFTLPGIGSTVVQAIQARDYPVVQSVVLLAAAAFIAVNMLADFTYGIVDPRIRRARKA